MPKIPLCYIHLNTLTPKLSRQELGGLSPDENSLQCKNIPTMLNIGERMEKQNLYLQIFVSPFFFPTRTLKQKL